MADDPITDDDTSEEYEDQTLVTKEGFKKLKEELDHLKKVRRQEVAQRLKEAISYGDLSENSEYEEAKNEQAFLEGRVIELERKIKNAKIITGKKIDKKSGKEAEIGSTVTVVNKTDRGDQEVFTIVGSTEADPIEGKVSNESPIGKSFLGSKKGDSVAVETPSGSMRYEILKVA
jgi:transcription elongation factor GreA